MEPSGDPFNSMVKLEIKNERPSNPFINASTIAIAGIIAENMNLKIFWGSTDKSKGNSK